MQLPTSLADLSRRALCHDVLAACLLGRRPADVPFLLPEHFPIYTDRVCWETMRKLDAHDIPLEATTLIERLKRVPTLEPVDWEHYILQIASEPSYSSGLSLETNAETMYDNWRRWTAAQQHLQGINDALDLTQPLADAAAPPGRAGRFNILSAAEALKPLPPVQWLVDRIVAPASVSIWYGKPATKKTYALLWLAASIAAGREWLGFKTRQAKVLVLDEESGEDRLHRRLHEVLNGAGLTGGIPLEWLPPSRFKLTDPQAVQDLCAELIGRGTGLVIIDSLAATTTGDENSKEFAQVPMDALRLIAQETKAHAAIIHHAGKNSIGEGNYRGSSVFGAAPDVLVEVRSPANSGHVEFATRKTRDSQGAEWAAQSTWTENADDPNLNAFSMRPAQVQRREDQEGLSGSDQYVIEYLSENGESSMDAIKAGAEGCTARAAQAAVYRLLKLGRVRRTNSATGGRGNTARFILAEGDENDLLPDEEGTGD